MKIAFLGGIGMPELVIGIILVAIVILIVKMRKRSKQKQIDEAVAKAVRKEQASERIVTDIERTVDGRMNETVDVYPIDGGLAASEDFIAEEIESQQ